MIDNDYRKKLISPEEMIPLIKPGFRIFISSGPAIPARTVTAIVGSDEKNIQDIEIIQLITLGDYISSDGDTDDRKYRLKTFNVGESISKEFREGRVDFIPANLMEIPFILLTGAVGVDMAVVQTSLPDERGFVNLGVANDVANIAIKKASLVVAEINPAVPRTFGETSLHISQFHHIVESSLPLIEVPRREYDGVYDRMGWHISNLVEDGSTVALHAGRMFDAIAEHLKTKHDLGIFTHVISDWVIDLIESGAVSLERSRFNGGQVTTSYCYGTRRLYEYVNNNPVFEFYPIARLVNPRMMGRASRLVSIMNVRKIDISGESVIFSPGDNLLSGYESKLNFAVGATLSRNGKAVVALRSTDREGASNIRIKFDREESDQVRSTLGVTRYVVTEYGVANLFGKSVRERVMSMIDIAHPEHREELLAEAKSCGYAYPDQIYVSHNAINYPYDLETIKTLKNGLDLKIRPIKPSDEDMMRRLFYQFSDESRYFRYFYRLSIMPHREMQKYVNIDYDKTLAMVGVAQTDRAERIVAEARYSFYKEEDAYEMAFIVDEHYQGMGIASFMLNYLIIIAQQRGLRALMANVLPNNNTMLHVFDRACIKPETRVEDGVVIKKIFLDRPGSCSLE